MILKRIFIKVVFTKTFPLNPIFIFCRQLQQYKPRPYSYKPVAQNGIMVALFVVGDLPYKCSLLEKPSIIQP